MPQGNEQVSTTLVTHALAAYISLTEQVMCLGLIQINQGNSGL